MPRPPSVRAGTIVPSAVRRRALSVYGISIINEESHYSCDHDLAH